MRGTSSRRAPVMTRAAPLFGLLADSYGLPTALYAFAAFPAAACALTFMLRDPRPRSMTERPA